MLNIKIDKIIKSRRRTFSIEIKKDGSVILRAPHRATGVDMKKVIDDKQDWICKTQKKILDKYSKVKPKEFKNGEEFLFLGEKIKLLIDEKISTTMFIPEDGFFMPAFCEEKSKSIFLEWYKSKAFEVINERVKYYSEIHGFKCAKIRISNAERIWGSCAASGNISFSWRLIMAPLPVIDYVVAHELAHLAHRDHSRRFWGKVAEIIPDFKKRRKWLKENEHLFIL